MAGVIADEAAVKNAEVPTAVIDNRLIGQETDMPSVSV